MTTTGCKMQQIVKVTLCILHLACVTHLTTGQDVEPHLEDDPSSWPGHLQPLAAASIKRPLIELQKFPSPSEFFQTYVYPSVPVVFKGGAKRSPAFAQWTDEYLKNLPGSDQLMSVEVKKVENREGGTRDTTFAEFLKRYQTHDEYLVADVPDFLKKDVLVPPPLHCDNVTANFLNTVLWFSSGGTKSVLHNDDVDNINCLFSGQKEILFINYTRYRQQIVFDHPEGSYSSVNVEQVDFNKYPELYDVEFWQAKLEAGDCIFIPYKWYHQVNSFNRNIAVNIWWNHIASIIPSPHTCGSPNPDMSLADVHFAREDEDSQEEFHLELAFLDDPGTILTAAMEEEELVSLTEEQLVGILSAKMPLFHGAAWNKEALDLGHELFQLLDVNDKQKITPEDLEMIPEEEDDVFYLQLQQTFVMLFDVLTEDISKKRLEVMQSSEGNWTTDNQHQGKDEL